MKISPELKQIIWNILAEENYFEVKKSTLLINNPKWNLDELKLLTRVLSMNYRKVMRKIEREQQERAKEICDSRDCVGRSDEEWNLSINRQRVLRDSSDESSNALFDFE